LTRTFEKIKIGFRSFFAPSDSPALVAQLNEIAEFAAKNPESLTKFQPGVTPRRIQTAFGFKTTKKPVSALQALAVVASPKGETVLKGLGNVKAIKARKIVIAGAKAIRPIAAFGGNRFAISKVSRGIALGINVISVSPVDVAVSFAFAIAELQQDPDRFGSSELTFLGDEEATRGEFVDVFAKEDVFVSQEGLQIAQVVTETADQLAFGFIPEETQLRGTEILAALFIDPVLKGASFLAEGIVSIQGDDPTVAPIGEAGF